MPVEDMEEQGLAKIPDLGVAQLKFQLQNLKYTNPTAKQQVSYSFVDPKNILAKYLLLLTL